MSELNYRCNPNFPNRYIQPSVLFKFIHENLSNYATQIGTSTFGQPIYAITLGHGNIKVLGWSQMHGNESNATHAFLDLLESWSLEQKEFILDVIQLDFILMLNPDGAESWTRRNGLNIDPNRDYNKRGSKEMEVFHGFLEGKTYDMALNLHEQRTVFSTDGINPATLSFLSPSEGIERDVTENRKRSMAVVNRVKNVLEKNIPNHLARYTDEFYPNAIGDNFMKAGIPNILFEGGHYENDYLRKNTRKYYTIALYEALRAIVNLKGETTDWEGYFDLPQNVESHFDVIYRNVSIPANGKRLVDIAVQYQEMVEKDKSEIEFVPKVVEIGDLRHKKGWKEIDALGREFVCLDGVPKIDGVQNFEIL